MKRLLKFATFYALAVEKMKMDISLNSNEEKIFALLRDVVSEKSPETVLRVAGGWVRDKLMGKDSNDIDIAVNNMTGEAFANLVTEYMREKGMKTGEVAVVEANPDQSKHLATAMVRLFGLPIDFVNLRTETYADSRIPEMQMGTPEEDAERRDLTINSLFWNVNTGEVEDYVGGLEDLRLGIARTPLDPVQTFLDDPLRILRTVRFAARYNLSLDPSIIEAAHDDRVKNAFKNKVSQERIWTELAGKKEGDKWKPGALIGPGPAKAIELLKQLGLMEAIFDPTEQEMGELEMKEEMVPWETDQNNPHHSYDIWNHTLNVVKNLVEQTKANISEDHETYLVRNLAALLHDIGKRYKGIQGTSEKGHTNYHGHEDLSAKIAEKVLQRLKAPKNIIKRVVKLIEVHLRPHMLEGGEGGAKALRRYVRDFDDWPHSIDLAIADNLGKQPFTDEQIPAEIEKYRNLQSQIENAMPNQNSSSIPRPITGKDLIGLGIKPGPKMGEILKALDEELLSNPNMSRDEALDFVRPQL